MHYIRPGTLVKFVGTKYLYANENRHLWIIMFLTMDEIIVTSINQSLTNLISKRILKEIAKFK